MKRPAKSNNIEIIEGESCLASWISLLFLTLSLLCSPGLESLLGLAIELGNYRRWEEAITKHEMVLQFDPNLVRAHINLISLYARVHELKKAEEHYFTAVRLDPKQSESHYNYGVLLIQENKPREAQARHISISADCS